MLVIRAPLLQVGKPGAVQPREAQLGEVQPCLNLARLLGLLLAMCILAGLTQLSLPSMSSSKSQP